MIIQTLAKTNTIFSKTANLTDCATVLSHFTDPEADVLISHDDSVIDYLVSTGFQKIDQIQLLLEIRSLIYKPGFSERLQYCTHADTWQELGKDYGFLIESLRLKGLRVSDWSKKWNGENGACHLAEHIWVKRGQRSAFGERGGHPEFLAQVNQLRVVDQITVHEVYSDLVSQFPELYRQTERGDLLWLEKELVDGASRRRRVGRWILFDPARATKYVEWIRNLSTIDIQDQPQDLRDIADLCFVIEHDLLGILQGLAPLCDASGPPKANVAEEILKIWLSTTIGRWYPDQMHQLTERLLSDKGVRTWQLDAVSRRLLDLVVFLGMACPKQSGAFLINDVHNCISKNIARLERHQTSKANWIDLYYAVKLELLWDLYCSERLSLRAYDDFKLAEVWRANQKELRQLFQQTYWPIFAALRGQYGLSDRFEATLESLSSSECLTPILSMLELPRRETTQIAGVVPFETQLADFYGARFEMAVERRSQRIVKSAGFSHIEFERLFISPFREKAVLDEFACPHASSSAKRRVQRAFSDYDSQLARVLTWIYPDGIPLPKITDIFPAILASVGLDVEARDIPYSSQARDLTLQLGGPFAGAIIFIFDAFGLTYLWKLLAHQASENRQDYETVSSILAEASQIAASTVFPSQTGPSHVSFITGSYPSEHLVFENRLGKGQHMLSGGVSVTDVSSEKLYFLDKLEGVLKVSVVSPYDWESDRLPAFLTHPLDVSDWDDPHVPLPQKVYIPYDRRDESEPYQTVLALAQELVSSNKRFVLIVLVGDVDSLEEHQPEELADPLLLTYFGRKYRAFLEMVGLFTKMRKQILIVQTADHGITAIEPARNVLRKGFSQHHFFSRSRYVEILPNAPADKVSEFKQRWRDRILDVLDQAAMRQLRWRSTDLPDELVLYAPHIITQLGRQKLKGHGGISVDEMIIPLIRWRT